MPQERVYDKINYQTNFTSTSTFAILLKAIADAGEVDSEYARATLFPMARSNAGMGHDPDKRDTHGELTLQQYGLIEYVGTRTFKLSPLGRKFLELFDEEFKPKEDNKCNYISTMLDALLAWKDTKNNRDINVGLLIVKLLLDEDLEYYITAEEWSFIAEFSDIKTDNDYERVKQQIIENREENLEIPLKKADVLLGGYVGTWKILDKANIQGEIRYKLSQIAKEQVLQKLRQMRLLETDVSNVEEEKNEMIDREPRENKMYPLNLIIYGAPGTGKTYSTAEYALAFIENRPIRENQLTESERKELMSKYRSYTKSGQVIFTTFHQSYEHEDFIQGLRPVTQDGMMSFVPFDGVFKKIADKAMADKNNNYVIIIDEINRGNISKIFGELITLIEEDKRWGECNQLSVMLPSGQEFAVPNNLYILGTMNSADKSIALIDTALRRRFEFIEIAPDASLVKDEVLRKVLTQLNLYLREQFQSSDLLIGHAYFIGKAEEDLRDVMNKNIIPLLYEYFYDDEKKIKNALIKAIEGTNVNIKESNEGRLKVE